MDFNKFNNKLEEGYGHSGSRAKRLLMGLYPDVNTAVLITYQNPHYNTNLGTKDNTKLKKIWDEYIIENQYSTIPLKGVYFFKDVKTDRRLKDVEYSFAVLNMSLDNARKAAEMFGQHSFVFIRFGVFNNKKTGNDEKTRFTSYVRRSEGGRYHKVENQHNYKIIQKKDDFIKNGEKQSHSSARNMKFNINFSKKAFEEKVIDSIYDFYDSFDESDLIRLKQLFESFESASGARNKWIYSNQIYTIYSKYIKD